MKQRVQGYDVARALAIFGMVIVNFKIAMNAMEGNALLLGFSAIFEGRASALFVILAGIGITFLSNKARASGDLTAMSSARRSIIKRGVLLVVVGLIYTPIWQADILHFYGCYFIIAAFIFKLNDKGLLRFSVLCMLVFPILMVLFDYEKNWNWSTLTYENLWTIDGMLRHILFNGFHPVFPWVAFLVFGMWLGRQDLSSRETKNKLFKIALCTLIMCELMFYFVRSAIGDGAALEMTVDEVAFLFSTSIIPPLPQYIISASSSAVIVLIGSLYFSEYFADSKLHKWFYQTGQLSLTLYVAHVIVGMGLLNVIGKLENQSIGFSLLSVLVFCAMSVCFSVLWLKYFKVGPLEWCFRKVVGAS
ncbi:DUF418 domain-containing protein [Flocculibacter collagenilyticus]|uniref:DUF418 domain-containing protein n=1 Tax=Flocculibacter collagenilyticus TaxID=2744479 RepID=UPI0018F5A8A1|nr:DUF418 domain-containing protein [Flocculibacter collagenilyticus]